MTKTYLEICRLWRQRRDLFSWEACTEQVNLIKVGQVWWFLRNKKFLRNSRQYCHCHTALPLLTGLTTPFSDVTDSCTTTSDTCALLLLLLLMLLLLLLLLLLKNEFEILFSLVFYPIILWNVPQDHWSTPLSSESQHHSIEGKSWEIDLPLISIILWRCDKVCLTLNPDRAHVSDC